MPRFLRPVWILYGLVLSLFAVFSYGLTAPNLILTSWEPYWKFQTWMWQNFFNQRHDLTTVYVALVVALFAIYGWLLFLSRNWVIQHPRDFFRLFIWWAGLLLPLMVGYNALSYDIFNYIFNARMMVLYQASPYQKVALDFAYDPWTRFMHNIHTPAPYGWGWTLFSLVGYVAGMGKFLLTWLIFKALGTLSLLGLWVTLKTSLKVESIKVAPWLLLFLNPLLLLEFGLVAHNDLWMMIPAVLSFLLIRQQTKQKLLVLALSVGLLGLSISVKLATIVLLPVWVGLLTTWVIPSGKIKTLIQQFWPVGASLVLLALLTTARSQYFHPWYLSWALVWLPLFPDFGKNLKAALFSNLVKIVLVCLSFTSLLRYIPWLLTGEYPRVVIYQQRVITWSGVLVGILLFVGWQVFQTLVATKRQKKGRITACGHVS